MKKNIFILLSLVSGIAHAGYTEILNSWFGTVNDYLAAVIFFDVFPGPQKMPFIVAWLIVAAVFLTIRMGFVNLSMMPHAFLVLAGRYKTKEDQGDVSPFQALTTALSATVGLGNIAGVAIAISLGGPGATLWMIIGGFFGMTAKFTEASLAQMYREFRAADGRVMGGAMEYLSKGFAEYNQPSLGRFLAAMFALFTILGSLGAGNAFQVSQSMGAVQQQIPFFAETPIAYGLLMAFLVGIVIIGGIRRIAYTAEAVVPTMVILYLSTCIWIILSQINDVPTALTKIFTEAFVPQAVVGGVVGALVQGFKRAAFSNEAGLGSAAIAHAAASVKYPIRQGMVALYEPFIDTIVICTMTALVIVLSGVYNSMDPLIAAARDARNGAALTSIAFAQHSTTLFPTILAISVFLFAYSTMISWSYYGERCWSYLFGEKTAILYKATFVIFIVLASIVSASNLLDFSDLLVLAMSFPNLIGLYLLSGKVKRALDEYRIKLSNGTLDLERSHS